GDPWTVVPSLTSIFPTLPLGSLPVAEARTQTAPEVETPCGCPSGDSFDDDHYILRILTSPIPEGSTNSILQFLLRYKVAAYHEVKYSGFSSGDYTNATLSILVSKNHDGMSELSFRLAASIADVI
ncbi:MAG: hypothetical protein WCH46_09370, partial [bacterium]